MRKGTWGERVARAWMQSPRALKLLLMNWASLSLSPCASVLPTLSLPARSTSHSLDRHTTPAKHYCIQTLALLNVPLSSPTAHCLPDPPPIAWSATHPLQADTTITSLHTDQAAVIQGRCASVWSSFLLSARSAIARIATHSLQSTTALRLWPCFTSAHQLCFHLAHLLISSSHSLNCHTVPASNQCIYSLGVLPCTFMLL